jgi:hypothetical protein
LPLDKLDQAVCLRRILVDHSKENANDKVWLGASLLKIAQTG